MTDVAAFDFDGTISKRDTLVPFLATTAGVFRFVAACSRLGLAGTRRSTSPGDRDRMKEHMIELLLGGRPEEEMRDRGERYARDLLTGDRLRTEMLTRVREHRRAGHRTVIVSASLVHYLDPIARLLDIDDVIGVEPEVIDGRLTGRLVRPNVRAQQKAVRLREWLDAPAEGPLGVRLHSYGNSSGDHELLAMADEAWWLGRPTKVPAGARVFTPGAPLG